MTGLAIILILNGVFNFAVWPTFLRRVARDTRARDARGKATRFLIVHVVIVTVALVLGSVSIIAGVVALVGLS